ncbi:MAG: hypothetical protein ACO1RX_02310 [Candidatus Sericytochromatia bacterium]
MPKPEKDIFSVQLTSIAIHENGLFNDIHLGAEVILPVCGHILNMQSPQGKGYQHVLIKDATYRITTQLHWQICYLPNPKDTSLPGLGFGLISFAGQDVLIRMGKDHVIPLDTWIEIDVEFDVNDNYLLYDHISSSRLQSYLPQTHSDLLLPIDLPEVYQAFHVHRIVHAETHEELSLVDESSPTVLLEVSWAIPYHGTRFTMENTNYSRFIRTGLEKLIVPKPPPRQAAHPFVAYHPELAPPTHWQTGECFQRPFYGYVRLWKSSPLTSLTSSALQHQYANLHVFCAKVVKHRDTPTGIHYLIETDTLSFWVRDADFLEFGETDVQAEINAYVTDAYTQESWVTGWVELWFLADLPPATQTFRVASIMPVEKLLLRPSGLFFRTCPPVQDCTQFALIGVHPESAEYGVT